MHRSWRYALPKQAPLPTPLLQDPRVDEERFLALPAKDGHDALGGAARGVQRTGKVDAEGVHGEARALRLGVARCLCEGCFSADVLFR